LESDVKRFFDFIKLKRKVSALEKKCSRLEVVKARQDKRLEAKSADWKKLQKQLQDQVNKSTKEIRNSKLLNDKMEEALSAVREEHNTANNITIPGLVAASQIMIDRWDAESRVQNSRVAAAKGAPPEEY